jgi:hypothetical protein
MDCVAVFTNDEENTMYLEVFAMRAGIEAVTQKIFVCQLESFENQKFKTDSARQLVSIFLSNSVSFICSYDYRCLLTVSIGLRQLPSTLESSTLKQRVVPNTLK